MHLANIPRKCFLFGQAISLLLFFIFCSLSVHAATYNLSTGSYPPCSAGTWSVNGSTYTCSNIVTLASGDTVVANTISNIISNFGFSLAGNTIGSAAVNINLETINSSGSASGINTIYGNVTLHGAFTAANLTVYGTMTVASHINLTGGAVTGLLTSKTGLLTTNGTNLSNGAKANNGMSITGGTVSGDFVMSEPTSMIMSGVTMTSGTISGATRVTIEKGCVLGSTSSPIIITTLYNEITVDNSIVYGHLTSTLYDYGVVNVTNGAAVYGTCLPKSNPLNACNANPPISSCPLIAGITGDYFNNPTLTAPVKATRRDGPINFDWGTGVPGPSGIPADNFSVRWDGYVYVPANTPAGLHSFQVTADDGVRLTVNGNLLIDQWNTAGTYTTADVNMAAGQAYPIKMEFNDKAGTAVAQLRWKTPGSSSYVVIPIGVTATPVTSAGLYQCNSLASYAISHSGTGVTCEGAPITFTALDSFGNVVTPQPGTTLTLSSSSPQSQWLPGNTVVFDGVVNSVQRILRQPIPATVNINVVDNNGVRESVDPPIVFTDAALIFSDIPTEVAGIVDSNLTLRVIKKDSGTGACAPQLIGDTTVLIAFSCLDPDTCVAGQQLTLNNSPAKPNNAGAPITYNSLTLRFDPSGLASIPLKYTDVGQVQLHSRIDLPITPGDPAVILGSSNPFVVKPYTLKVSGVQQAAAPFTPNPGTTNSGAGFIPADEEFKVTVQSFNSAGAITPNFGNERRSERNKIELIMGCPERDDENDPPCLIRKPDHPSGGSVGNLDIARGSPVATTAGGVFSATWDEVGSFRVEAGLPDPGYLGGGPIAKVTPSGIIGRFFPDHFTLTDSTLDNSCDRLLNSYSYMSQPLRLNYELEAHSLRDNTLDNYGPAYGTMPSITYVAENADSGVNLGRFSDGITQIWANGILPVDSFVAMFSRSLPNGVPDGPYGNLQIGLQLTDTFDSRVLQDLDMNATTVGFCTNQTCTQKRLGRELNLHYGRLRIDDAFGPETADLPVNFVVEHWVGNIWAKNESDSCTAIARNNIFYGPPEKDISTEANLTIALSGGSTTGSYAGMNPGADPAVVFSDGDAGHQFSAPGRGTGSFFEKINLASYPWLTFDWNQSGGIPTSAECNPVPPAIPDADCTLRANFNFGSYRGHDRVIYWREILK